MTIVVIQCPINFPYDPKHCKKGANKLDEEETYTFFCPDDFIQQNNYKCQILLFMTKPNKAMKSNLLLMRDYENEIPNYNNSSSKNLFKALRELLGANNTNYMEVHRSGGAMGLISYNRELKDLLFTPNSSPRKSKGVLVLRGKDLRFWLLIYRGTKDGLVKSHKYANPKYGGRFKMTMEIFQQFPFLYHFCMWKPLCLIIMETLQLDGIVSPTAFRSERKKLDEVKIIVDKMNKGQQCFKDTNEIWSQYDRLQKYCYIFSKYYDTYTLVTHPVGRHVDIFQKETPCKLENRFLIRFCLDQNNQTNLKGTGYNHFGRGGSGLSNYVFSVLDW